MWCVIKNYLFCLIPEFRIFKIYSWAFAIIFSLLPGPELKHWVKLAQ